MTQPDAPPQVTCDIPRDGEGMMMALWDVLESCANGRTDGHHCPYRHDTALDCEVDEGWVRVKCTGCGLAVEASMR